MEVIYDTYPAPIGPIRLIANSDGVLRVVLTPEHWEECLKDFPGLRRDPDGCAAAIGQLDEYFRGERREFDVPLVVAGPEFSRKVWAELRRIPFGTTRSYAEMAQLIGCPGGCRAVGQANRRNPLPIFIPCHRVIGKDGALTGFAGKGYLGMKDYLLRMERGFRQEKPDSGANLS